VLHLEVSTPLGPELHLDVSTLLRLVRVVLRDVSTPQGSELHLDVYGQQEPLLLLDVTTHKTCLHIQGHEKTLDEP
jgi:hypothetical protein